MSKSQKGSQYERDISRQLSIWWSEGKEDDWFWRTDTSGGRATTRAKSGKATANAVGDLSSRTPEGDIFLREYIVEIKRGYNDLEVIPLLDKNNFKSNHLVVWWEKLYREACQTSRKPLLIFKRDRAHACIVISNNVYLEMQGMFDDFCFIGKEITFPCSDRTLHMMRLEHFLQWINPRVLKHYLINQLSVKETITK
jgi:hypothetical protein